MISIYIGVCRTRDDERFIESFRNFTDSICNKYSICINTVRDTYLPDAQNYLAREFLNNGYDYLLLLDDDHSGHTLGMLQTLIDANTYVATIKTYSRHYPYSCADLNYLPNNKNLALPIENVEGNGYIECDLTGFPMTLVSRETFEFLDQPYFRSYESGGRAWNSDVDFFNRLSLHGIKPIACFQHCLNHDKITQENVKKFRYDERFTNNNLPNFKMLQDIENGSFKIDDLTMMSIK